MRNSRTAAEASARRVGLDPTQVKGMQASVARQTWSRCLHEAGHAIAAEAVGGDCVDVNMPARGQAYVRWNWHGVTGRHQVRVHLAGIAAELLTFDECRMPAGGPWKDLDDARAATEAAGAVFRFEEARDDAIVFLRPHRRAIHALATELLAIWGGTLSGDAVREIMQRHPPEQPRGNRRARRRRR